MTGACATSCATRTARKSLISTFQPHSTITVRCIAPTCTIPTCRMRGRAGRSSRCGTTTSSPGSAGRDFRSSVTRRHRRRRARSRRIKRGSNISRRACANPGRHRSSDSIAPKVVDAPVTRFDAEGLGDEPNNLTRDREPDGLSRASFRAQCRSPDHGSAQLPIARSRPAGPRPRRSRAMIFRISFHRRRWRSWMRAAPMPAVIRRRASALAPPRWRTSARTNHHRRFSGRAEGLVSRSPQDFRSDLEDLGQFTRHARLSRRPTESSAAADETVAGSRLCRLRWWRSQCGLRRARRDLRPGTRYRHHGLRHRGGRSAQLLGGSRGQGAAAGQVRARRHRVHYGLGFRARSAGSVSSTAFQRIIRCAPCFLRRGRDNRRGEPSINLLLHHGVRTCLEYHTERRHRARTAAFES